MPEAIDIRSLVSIVAIIPPTIHQPFAYHQLVSVNHMHIFI